MEKVTSSVQYCAVNKSPCGQTSMTGHEGKQVTGSAAVLCYKYNLLMDRANMTGHEGKEVTGSAAVLCWK